MLARAWQEGKASLKAGPVAVEDILVLTRNVRPEDRLGSKVRVPVEVTGLALDWHPDNFLVGIVIVEDDPVVRLAQAIPSNVPAGNDEVDPGPVSTALRMVVVNPAGIDLAVD